MLQWVLSKKWVI